MATTPSLNPSGPPGFARLPVVVAGGGIAGIAAAEALRSLGADVTVVDVKQLPARPGLRTAVDDGRLPVGTRLVVASPGWRPDAPLLVAAATADVPVWGEVEFAWRIRPPGQDWLGVTGTNGKTTTTGMLASILAAAGLRSAAAGNIGTPITETVRARPPYQVLAVELSSFQLHGTATIDPVAAAVLNIAGDHLDWHGSMANYTAAKARIFGPATVAIFDADDPGARSLVAERPGAIGVTRSAPADGMLGVSGGVLVDRARGGGEILPVAELPVPGPHNVTNALAAAALARAYGIEPAAVAGGLRSFVPGPHRLSVVGKVSGITFVDDSKGTNPHATAAALRAFPEAVWIAGGLAKGATFDALVREHAQRLRGAVLIGTCAPQLEEALARHAAHVPVIRASDLDNAVREAAGLAPAGGVVLMSPAAASMDMFDNYEHRGEAFAAAVRALAHGASASSSSDPTPEVKS